MTDRPSPILSKWPFYLGDILLLLAAAAMVFHSGGPGGPWPLVICAVAVASGAWLCVLPHLLEYRAAVRLTEVGAVSSAVAQIQQLELVAEQISGASSHWQHAQEQSAKTVDAAKEISQRIAVEAKSFADFLQKSNDGERANLRLEIEKLRRGEGEWLQIVVHLLDHVYALYSAAARSGQQGLVEQLGNFQNACRDVARRAGVVAFGATRDEPFDPRAHQTTDSEKEPPSNSKIAETLATGYTFQGQLLRRALVVVSTDSPVSDPAPSTPPKAAILTQGV